MTPTDLVLSRTETALVFVDLQERLAAAMDPAALALATRRWVELARTAAELAMPVVITEQYPKGIGPTLPAVREALGPAFAPVEKLAFDCTRSAPFLERLAEVAPGRSSAIVVGMEAHVCVYQTARGLAARGWRVHVPRDAALSRREADREVGLRLCADAGAVVSCAETVIFDLLGAAGTPEFKSLSALLRER